MSTKRNFNLATAMISATLIFCIAMLMVCTFSFSASAASTNQLIAISDVNLRASASSTGTVQTTVKKGDTVTLLQNSSKGWAKVKYSTYTGYCSTAYLKPATDSGVTMTGRTTADVNLRSGRGTSYDVLTVVPNDTRLTVTSNSYVEWAKATYSGYTGYVSKDYIVITLYVSKTSSTEATQAPTVTATQGFTYADPDFSSLPHWYSYSLTDTMIGTTHSTFAMLMLDKSELTLDINATYKLTPFVSGSTPVLNHVSFATDKSSVASVSATGTVTGVSNGTAVVTATDLVTGRTATCKVNVSENVMPTEPSTETPTVAPTEPPTAAPTAAETQPPTTAPTQAPTAAPTQAPTTVKETLSLSDSELKLYVGTQYIIVANSNATVSWSTSNSSVATVSGGVVTVKSAGTAVITAKTSTKTAKCTITAVDQRITIHSSTNTATVTAGKTYFAKSNTSDVTWTSHNTDVATVKDGLILGVSPGKAIIEIYKRGGKQTILVTVTAADPVRFAYTSPNCAPKNSDVTLIAITDTTRTDVRFNVTVGSTTKTVYADSKTKDGSTYVWKGTTSFDKAGTYNVKAYSKLGSKWSTCSDGATTAFVTSTTDKNTTTCENRRASDDIIEMIAGFEGYLPDVYYDVFTGDPTLGYGKLVFVGEQFYNNLTKNEAYAYLSQTVNNEGYSSKVNSFLVGNNVKFNQQQFDALVCFVYNVGTGVLTNDDDLSSALLNCSSGSSSSKTTYYINGSYVRIRKGPGTSYDIIDELDYGTTLTILEKTSSSWYYVQLSDGTKGYVATDYIASKTSSGGLDLNYVKQQNLINKFCQYHHANGCIRGLLYRRMDEMEVFFYNDYDIDYGANNYGISFTCASNSGFHT